jgi:predicted membrane protein
MQDLYGLVLVIVASIFAVFGIRILALLFVLASIIVFETVEYKLLVAIVCIFYIVYTKPKKQTRYIRTLQVNEEFAGVEKIIVNQEDKVVAVANDQVNKEEKCIDEEYEYDDIRRFNNWHLVLK